MVFIKLDQNYYNPDHIVKLTPVELGTIITLVTGQEDFISRPLEELLSLLEKKSRSHSNQALLEEDHDLPMGQKTLPDNQELLALIRQNQEKDPDDLDFDMDNMFADDLEKFDFDMNDLFGDSLKEILRDSDHLGEADLSS